MNKSASTVLLVTITFSLITFTPDLHAAGSAATFDGEGNLLQPKD